MFNFKNLISSVLSISVSKTAPVRRKMTFVEYDESQSWALDEWIMIEESGFPEGVALSSRAKRESIVRSEGTLRAAGRRMAAHRPKGFIQVSYSPVDWEARSRGYHL